jgi:hypothetical protein
MILPNILLDDPDDHTKILLDDLDALPINLLIMQDEPHGPTNDTAR